MSDTKQQATILTEASCEPKSKITNICLKARYPKTDILQKRRAIVRKASWNDLSTAI